MSKGLDSLNFTAKLVLLVLPVAIALVALLGWLTYVSVTEKKLDEKIGILNGLRGDIMLTSVISAQYANAVENQIIDTMQVKRTDIHQTLARIQTQHDWIGENLPELSDIFSEIISQNQLITSIVTSDEDIVDESGLLSDMAQEGYKAIEVHTAESVTAKASLNEKFGMQELTVTVIIVILIASALVYVIANRITQPINQAVRAMHDIAEGEGDLTQRLSLTTEDELGDLTRGFNVFITKMQELVLMIRVTMSNISAASNEIAKGSSDLSERTNSQTAVLHETSNNIAQLATTVARNADSAREAKDLAINAHAHAEKGGDIVHKAIDAMQGVDESSSRMGEILDTINSIAFQTNILALNAAVEAARAGEQGRGFAVVASEVRLLSERSATAAQEIGALVNGSLDSIRAGSELVSESGGILRDIVESTSKVAEIVMSISDASQGQAFGITELNDAVRSIEEVTQHNAALVEEFTATTESTNSQVTSLSRLLATFKVESGSNETLVESEEQSTLLLD